MEKQSQKVAAPAHRKAKLAAALKRNMGRRKSAGAVKEKRA